MYFFSDVIRDQYERPVPSAEVSVRSRVTGQSVTLYDASESEIDNPAITNDLGYYSFYVTTSGFYILSIYYGCRLVQQKEILIGITAEGSATLIYELAVDTEGQTVFTIPVEMLFTPEVYINGDRIQYAGGANFSYSGTQLTLAVGAHLSDDIAVAIGQSVDQGSVRVGNVLGLPAYVQGVLGSRSANLQDIAGFDPTGTHDMASGVQTILNQAAVAKLPTYAPGGSILLGSTVGIPGCTDFRGTGGPTIFSNDTAGTVFKIGHSGKGFIGGGIRQGETRLTDVVIYRNQPAVIPGTPWTPANNDWDIWYDDVSDFHATRLLHFRSTKGIYMNGNRNKLHDWGGQFFQRGLQIDWNYDSIEMVGHHVWDWWSQTAEVWAYMLDNLQTYTLGRVDNPFFERIFSIRHKYAFYIDQFPGDGPNRPAGTVNKMKLIGADLDIGQYAYYVAPAANGHTAKFQGVTAQGSDQIINAPLLFVEGPNTKIIGDFGGDQSGSNVVRLKSTAAGSELSLLVSSNSWNRSNVSYPAVEVETGGGHVTLLPGSKPMLTGGNGGAISGGNVTVIDP